jgi:hypothetical protein
MAVKFASLRADVEKEKAGDWVEIVELPGVELRVRSFNDPQYKIHRDQLLQRLARKYGRKPVPGDESEVEFGRLYARFILLEWKGFDEAYSEQRALEALTDPAMRDLRRHVEYAAGQVGASDIEFVEEMAGE